MTLPNEDFARVREFLADAAGLVFDDSRRAGLAAVLAERLRATRTHDVPSYLDRVAGPHGEAERQRLLDAVTVQETQFFRNPPQLDALRRRVLPELLRRAAGRERPLTIWSAGCSTGEEAYTLAMLLLDLAPALGYGTPARIVATDVSAAALDVARRAIYAGRTVEAAPAVARERWFERVPGGALAVRPEVRGLVELLLHNLVTDAAPFAPGEVDLVVCRNVTIYFSRETTAALVGGFHDVLAEGGYLLLGHSETLWQVSDAFTLVPVGDAFVYRRTHDARRTASRQPLPVGPALPMRDLRTVPPRRRRQASQVAQGPPAVTEPALRPKRSGGDEAAGRRERSGGDEAVGRLAASRAALDAGAYDSAVREAELAVIADPLLAEAYVVLGQARATMGQDVAALDPLRKAVYLDPVAGHAHFLLAGCLAKVGQQAQAAVSYRAAASSLAQVDPSTLRAFLGGRDVQELVDLCRRLADLSGDADSRDSHQATAGRRAR